MTTYTNQRHYQREPSLADLFSDLSADASLLVRQEVQLAKSEMTQKATRAGREIAVIAVGGVLANAALLILLAALILALEAWMPLWLSALLVGVAVAIVAGILAWTGFQALKEMNVVPSQTAATLQEDKEWLAQQMN